MMRRSLIACSKEVCNSSSSIFCCDDTTGIAGLVANQSSITGVSVIRSAFIVVSIASSFTVSSVSAVRHSVYMFCNSFLLIYSLYAPAWRNLDTKTWVNRHILGCLCFPKQHLRDELIINIAVPQKHSIDR